MSRPEAIAPPEIFYNDIEAKKYAENTRILEIQSKMTQRACELMNLPMRWVETESDDESDDEENDEDEMEEEEQREEVENFVPQLILDIGCGSGISGQVLSDYGHHWVGIDISANMLDVAQKRHCEGDLFLQDMGQGVSFRLGTFDGAISISAIQWLCNADAKDKNPYKRLYRFFSSLYKCLRKGARAVLQFYPEGTQQMEMITEAALKAGFSGGIVVDYPNSARAKKYFLCLFAGIPDSQIQMPKGKSDEELYDEEQTQIKYYTKQQGGNDKRRRGGERDTLKGSVKWIKQKKERDRARGKQVPSKSKYTGRKRGPRF